MLGSRVIEVQQEVLTHESRPENKDMSSGQTNDPIVEGRPRRVHRMPARYRDVLPRAPPAITPMDEGGEGSSEAALRPDARPQVRVRLRAREQVETAKDPFGVFRKYFDRPTYEPDGEITLDDLAGLTPQETEPPVGAHPEVGVEEPGTSKLAANAYQPFPNASAFMLSNWYYDTPSGERSDADFNRLVAVISDPRFISQDIIGFTASKRDKLLDRLDEEPDSVNAGWKRNIGVHFQVPEGKNHWTDPNGRTFVAPGLHHRSITQIVCSLFETKTNLHYTPFEMWWQPTPDTPAERVYSDLYTSPAFIEAHREVNFNPEFQVPGCKLEKVVAAIMIWSDSTHLAQFGTAKLWPIYAFPGNMSKWFRCKPNSNSCEHWAYIPSVSDRLVWNNGALSYDVVHWRTLAARCHTGFPQRDLWG
jgi:Plavaka transposase